MASAVPAGTVLLLAGCAKDEAVVFPGDPQDPENLVVTKASPTAVELRWQHDDDDESGFRIERVVAGQVVVLAELPEDSNEYTDSDPDPDRTMRYRVRALYGSTATAPSDAPLMNLAILPPDSSIAAASALNPDSIRISWLPPDFEVFDGFGITRLLRRDGEVALDRVFLVDHETSLPAEFIDDDLPPGAAVGDRLEYLVATRQAPITASVFSGPAPADRFQWSFPTGASTVSTDPRAHDTAEAHYIGGTTALGIISNTASDGSSEVLVIDPDIQEAQAFVLFREDRPSGSLAATVHLGMFVVLVERPDGAVTTTFSRHTLSNPPTLINQFDVADAVVGVWAVPLSIPTIAILEGATCRTLDPDDGTPIDEITFDNPLASAAFLPHPIPNTKTFQSGVTVAVVETRGNDDTAQSRIAYRSFPGGTQIWTTGWFSGQVVSPMSGLVVSRLGGYLALNLTLPGGTSDTEETRLFALNSPLPLATRPGRSVTFLENDTHVVILNPYPAVPEAFQITESGLNSDGTFGTRSTTTAFTAPGNRVWTWQRDASGVLRVYDMVKQWSRVPAPGAREAELEDAPRFYLVTP